MQSRSNRTNRWTRAILRLAKHRDAGSPRGPRGKAYVSSSLTFLLAGRIGIGDSFDSGA